MALRFREIYVLHSCYRKLIQHCCPNSILPMKIYALLPLSWTVLMDEKTQQDVRPWSRGFARYVL